MAQHNILLFDSSALVGYMKTLLGEADMVPSEAYAAHQHYLELWQDELGIHKQPDANAPNDHVSFDAAIPDHVFYEVTGILPISLKYLREQAKDHNDAIKNAPNDDARSQAAASLQKIIDVYVEASPRLYLRGPKGDYNPAIREANANQLRFLLTLACYYPDTIKDTEVGQRYSQKLRAEYSTMRPLPKQEVSQEIEALRNGQPTRWVESYVPNFGDIDAALGDDFQHDALRLHASQAWLMDFIKESRYRSITENKGNHKGNQDQDIGYNPRFINVADFVGRTLQNKQNNNKGSLIAPNALRDIINANFDTWVNELAPSKSDRESTAKALLKRKITIGDVRRLTDGKIPLFRESRAEKDTTMMPLDHALAHSRMMIEQYIFGDVLPGADFKDALITEKRKRISSKHDLETALQKDGHPPSEATKRLERVRKSGAAIDVMAEALGYDVSAWQSKEAVAAAEDLDPAAWKEPEDFAIEQNNLRMNSLRRQGFLERQATVEDLVTLESALQRAGIETSKLSTTIDALPHQLSERWKTINAESIRKSGFETPPNDKMPGLGTPVEKIFTEGTISGAVTKDEFFAILQKIKDHSVHEPNEISSINGQVSLKKTADGYDITFNADGIAVRSGNKEISPLLQRELKKVASEINEDGTHYYTLKLDDLLHIARKHRYRNEDQKPGKVLEGLFFLENLMLQLCDSDREKDNPDHAAGLLKSAVEVLGEGAPDPHQKGEDRLIQLQKDFESYHERRFTGEANMVRPVANIMAANQRNHRMFRRNLGEVAVAEVGANMAEAGQHVWLIANDSDIMPGHLDGQGNTVEGKPEFHGITLKPHVLRQHSYFQGVASTLQGVNDDAGKAQKLQLVPTDQWLNTLAGKTEQKNPPGSWTKNKQPFNNNWAEKIQDAGKLPVATSR